MDLTPAQLQAIKVDIAANPDLAAFPNNSDGNFALAAAYNTTVQAFIVWKSSVTQDEVMLNGFDWARVDNLSVGKARIWEWLFKNAAGAINPSKTNIRAGIDACWTGTAADLAVRAAVYVHCKRAATRIEKLFATGTGTDATPATMAVEGDITPNQVQEARDLA
jgi:hypothetical protein